MECAACGKEIAQTARSCIHCGAVQPLAPAGAGRPAGEAANAPGTAAATPTAPRRSGSVAFTIGACIAIGLVAVAAWRVLDSGSPPREAPASGSPSTSVPTGEPPPPADQSAAPLPAPGALPPLDVGKPSTETGGRSDAAGAETPPLEESAAMAASAPAAAGGSSPPAGAAKAARRPGEHEAGQRPSRPARPAVAARPPAGAAKPAATAKPEVPAAKATPATPPDRWARMEADLAKCTREDFINRVICAQRVKFRYCGDYWGKVPQCPGSPASDHG